MGGGGLRGGETGGVQISVGGANGMNKALNVPILEAVWFLEEPPQFITVVGRLLQ